MKSFREEKESQEIQFKQNRSLWRAEHFTNLFRIDKTKKKNTSLLRDFLSLFTGQFAGRRHARVGYRIASKFTRKETAFRRVGKYDGGTKGCIGSDVRIIIYCFVNEQEMSWPRPRGVARCPGAAFRKPPQIRATPTPPSRHPRSNVMWHYCYSLP